MGDKYLVKPGLHSFYSAAQVQAYLQRIRFNGDTLSFHPNLKNLQQLVRRHLVAFPFENSRLHYAANHEMDVTPEGVYSHLVEKRRGGSWCYGHNGMFLGMLRGLGYRGFAGAARVNHSPPGHEAKDFTNLSHLVLFIQLNEEPVEANASHVFVDSKGELPRRRTYLVDVGFGGSGIVRPMLLEVGQTISGSAPPEEHRLVRQMHPESSLLENDTARVWALQYRCGSYRPEWTVLYIFDETECYPRDWIAYSQWLCDHPVELFANNVVCVSHFLIKDDGDRDNGDDAQLGRIMMMGRKVQRRFGAEVETIKEFTMESERVRILKEDFGITVDEAEICNIAHMSAALPR